MQCDGEASHGQRDLWARPVTGGNCQRHCCRPRHPKHADHTTHHTKAAYQLSKLTLQLSAFTEKREARGCVETRALSTAGRGESENSPRQPDLRAHATNTMKHTHLHMCCHPQGHLRLPLLCTLTQGTAQSPRFRHLGVSVDLNYSRFSPHPLLDTPS